jgi:hypothetical protein
MFNISSENGIYWGLFDVFVLFHNTIPNLTRYILEYLDLTAIRYRMQ